MPRPQPHSTDELMAREIDRQLHLRARAMAEELGRPAGTQQLSEKEQLRHWLMEHVGGAQWAQQLALGMTPDPKLLTDHPKADRVIEMLGKGQLPEAVTIAQYPFREDLATTGQTGIEGVVKYAERMSRLAQQAEQAAQGGIGEQDAKQFE